MDSRLSSVPSTPSTLRSPGGDSTKTRFGVFKSRSNILLREKSEGDPEVLTDGLFDEQTEWDRIWGPLLAVAIQLLVVVLLLCFIALPVWATYEGSVTPIVRNLYTVGTTVVATAIAAFTAAQMRWLWLRDILDDAARRETARSRRARVLLQISSVRDQFYFFPAPITLAAFGLVTSAIVGAVALTTLERQYRAISHLNDSRWLDQRTFPQSCWTSNDARPPNTLAWPTSDGKFLVAGNRTTDSYQCPGWLAQNYDYYISAYQDSIYQNYAPPHYCMSAGATYMACDTLGAPISSSVSYGAFATFGDPQMTSYTRSRKNFHACVPVAVRNPVSCWSGGDSVLPGEERLRGSHCAGLNLNDTNESRLISILSNSTEKEVACLSDQRPGAATLVLGSSDADWSRFNNVTSAMQGKSGGYGSVLWLSALLDLQPPPESRRAYSAVCNIDMSADNFAYQWLWMDDQGSGDLKSLQTTGQSCDPMQGPGASANFTPSDTMVASATAGLVEWMKRRGIARQFEALYPATSFQRAFLPQSQQPIPNAADVMRLGFGLKGSRNSIEDVLGTVLLSHFGLFLGAHIGRSTMQTKGWDHIVEYNSDAERVGAGSWWGVLYILPSLYCIATILILMQRAWRRDRRRENVAADTDSERGNSSRQGPAGP